MNDVHNYYQQSGHFGKNTMSTYEQFDMKVALQFTMIKSKCQKLCKQIQYICKYT